MRQQNLVMSSETAPRSHAMTWAVTMLVLLLIYAASWPPVEIKMATRSPYGRSFIVRTPRWVDVMYRPMRFLGSTSWGHGPLVAYYYWWQKILK